MAERQVDILIVGGGLTGAALMLALTELGYTTCLVEANALTPNAPTPALDGRSIALSPASVRILNQLGVWSQLAPEATPIKTIHVSEQNRLGRTVLQGEPNQPLGYVVEMHTIQRALHALLPPEHLLAPASLTHINFKQHTATVQTPTGNITLRAQLIVAADGTHSKIRQLCGLVPDVKPYDSCALVTNIELARPHHGIAYERFLPSGPLALLPLSNTRSALIWSLPPPEAERYRALPPNTFLSALQHEFGYRLGRFIEVGQRSIFPLKQVIMPQQVHDHVVFVGNSAHTLHPVAAQGFNLGLRDIALLAQCIAETGPTTHTLQSYQKQRQQDQATTVRFTDQLVSLFASTLPGLGMMRGGALMAFDHLPFLKLALIRLASGFTHPNADLVCGIPLKRRENV